MAENNTIAPIKTVVVLIMENRSFDNILGWQKRINPEINGVTGQEFNLLSTTDPMSKVLYYTDNAEYVVHDPGHSFQAIREQVFGSDDTSANPPSMSGFAQEAEKESKGLSNQVMSGFKPAAIPIHTALQKEFAVFDRWFASVPSSTQPNRLFVHSATSHGLTSNVTQILAEGLPQRTIFDNVWDAGLSFGIYFQDVPSTFFYRRLRQLKYIDKFHPFYPKFKNDAKDGKLPNYVVLEPRYYDLPNLPANDDHPPHDVRDGQKLIKEVYEDLRASPQWNEMLLIVTYDEHGGFYDHVPPPVSDVPNPDGITGPEPFYFNFDRLGVRVPTIIISPWIEKGTVIHKAEGPTRSSEFEHSSIPATVKKLFNLPSDFLTRRDKWAGTFEGILTSQTTPRSDCPYLLPDSPAKDDNSKGVRSLHHNVLSEFQEELLLLGACLKGAEKLDGFDPGMGKKMSAVEAHEYLLHALEEFFQACKSALHEAGIDRSLIVCMDGKGGYKLERI